MFPKQGVARSNRVTRSSIESVPFDFLMSRLLSQPQLTEHEPFSRMEKVSTLWEAVLKM